MSRGRRTRSKTRTQCFKSNGGSCSGRPTGLETSINGRCPSGTYKILKHKNNVESDMDV